MRRALVAVGLLVACSRGDHHPSHKSSAPAEKTVEEIEVPARPIEHRMSCGNVTAIWRGERIDGRYDHYDSMWLEVRGRAPVEVTADDSPELATFDVFSPDCKHVLILRSRSGPYHIVATARVAAYLDGAKPDHVLAGERSSDGITGSGVFHDGGWISNDEVGYQWGCCDPPVFTRYKLDGTSTSKLAPPMRH
ncbi:MAG TPA: hypothetical protein VL326_09960 [Kofleriaceae bacterium]|nr:hypothetical protein [Kofleriaceae bacterium]